MTTNISEDRPALSLQRIRLARVATFFGFAQLGAVMLTWSTNTTALRAHLGWSGEGGDSNFGLVALAIGVGAAVGCFLIGPFVDRYGPRATCMPTMIIYPLMYIPFAFLQGIASAMFLGVMIGLLRGAFDTAFNTHGVQVERYYGRPIMSAFHAAYPAGGFVIGLVASAIARHYVESPAVAYISIGVTMSVLGAVFGRWLLTRDELLPPAAAVAIEKQSTTERSASTTTLLIMAGFGLLMLASMLSEGAILDWGQEFVRRHADTSAGMAATAVTFYSGAQFVGRLFGDRLAEYFGARVIVAVSGVIGFVGALLAIGGASAPLALVGFVLLGLGLACMAPLMLSAAGRRDPENAGRNIGIVNAIGYVGMLAGPAAITLIVDGFGIGWMPALPAILLLLIAVGGPVLMKTVPRYSETERTGNAPKPEHHTVSR